MAVEMRPMRDDEFDAWFPQMREGFAQALIEDGGFAADGARSKAAEDMERLFPGERPSPEQLVFVIEADGEPVGDLWLCERDDALQPCLFVYDVHLREDARGRGYGKAAMLFAEEEARRRGRSRIALNVFGRNEVARALYLSLGYEENAIAMSKSL